MQEPSVIPQDISQELQSKEEIQQLLASDKSAIWHPLTQHQLYPNPMLVTKALGVWIYAQQDENQEPKKYIDAISSWYTVMYGHCNPYITQRVSAQLQSLDQVIFSGFTHRPAIELSKRLLGILPENQQKVFFSDNGSTANEVAIKMALQFHHNQGASHKNTLIAFENGFHGDTFGAMSVSGLSVYNGPFSQQTLCVKRIAVPTASNYKEVLFKLERFLQTDNIAAFIYEPLVQGANAMQMYEASYLEKILQLCKQYNTLTIADEVMTGFGKTGRYFASDYLTTKPDIITLSKALTAGIVPMAVTSCTQDIYDAFLGDTTDTAFFHAHTYTANPVGCIAALSGIEVLTQYETQRAIQEIIAHHKAFDNEIKNHPKIRSTRQLGVIYAMDFDLEISRYGKERQALFEAFWQRGVYLRPLGNTVYLVPPYVISKEELQQIYTVIRAVLYTL